MSESADALPETSDVWDFIDNGNVGFLVPLTATKSLDLLSCLHNVHIEMQRDVNLADEYLTSVVTAMVAAAEGQGDKIVDEIIIRDSMANFDQKYYDVIREQKNDNDNS